MSSKRCRGIRVPRVFAAAAVVVAGLGLAACVDVAGIEDVSGSQADEDAETCLAVVNAHRIARHLPTVERWLDYEACAVQTGEQLLGEASKLSCDAPSTLLCQESNAAVHDALAGCAAASYAVAVGNPAFTELACGCGRKDANNLCVMYFR